jgi:RNA polymerase sigma-70 factor (sigma-E family)
VVILVSDTRERADEPAGAGERADAERSDDPGGRPAPVRIGFEEYVAARGSALVRFAILLTGDLHRAEDLVQDALARTYLRWGRIRRVDNPDVYVRRLLVNASRSWWRRRTNRELPVERAAERPAPGDMGAESAERDALRRLIATLPHRQRAVLVLRYYEDLDDITISEILDCSPVTVRTHAMRALNALRKHYGAGAVPGHGRI